MSDAKANKVAELLADTVPMASPEQSAEVAREVEHLRGLGLRTVGESGWLDRDAPPLRVLLTVQGDNGRDVAFMPAGTVAMMVAPGGTGKTQALVQLAIAVASGTRWMETYTATKPGAVLLALGEEDGDEMHRRIRSAVHAGRNDTADLTARNLHTIALRGVAAGMVDKEGKETDFAKEFRSGLKAMGVEWSLIILDPGSRFMGPEAEKDNAQATRFIECLERLTELPGRPTVLLAHHTAKTALGGNTDQGAARGSSALTDGVRWQVNLDRWIEVDDAGVLVEDKKRCKLALVKANHVAPCPPLNLRKEQAGYLVPTDYQGRPVTAKPRGSGGGANNAAKAQEKIGALEGAAESLKRLAADAAEAVAAHKATPQNSDDWEAERKRLDKARTVADRAVTTANVALVKAKGAQSGPAPKASGRDKAGGQ